MPAQTLTDLQSSRYLERIGLHSPVNPDAASLRALQLAHLGMVPFENLDIHFGEPLSLDPSDLYGKIVERKRGGFCYEVNGLFALLLESVGYQVTRLAAREVHPDGSLGLDFDHLTLLVQAPGDPTRWLLDVGWGDAFREPLHFDQPGEQVQGRRAYRIENQGDYRLLWERKEDDEWKRQYAFRLAPQRLDAFALMCRYHQTSPESVFTQKRLCTLATEDGRITLSERRFIVTQNGERRERQVADAQEYCQILAERFGIQLPVAQCERIENWFS